MPSPRPATRRTVRAELVQNHCRTNTPQLPNNYFPRQVLVVIQHLLSRLSLPYPACKQRRSRASLATMPLFQGLAIPCAHRSSSADDKQCRSTFKSLFSSTSLLILVSPSSDIRELLVAMLTPGQKKSHIEALPSAQQGGLRRTMADQIAASDTTLTSTLEALLPPEQTLTNFQRMSYSISTATCLHLHQQRKGFPLKAQGELPCAVSQRSYWKEAYICPTLNLTHLQPLMKLHRAGKEYSNFLGRSSYYREGNTRVVFRHYAECRVSSDGRFMLEGSTLSASLSHTSCAKH